MTATTAMTTSFKKDLFDLYGFKLSGGSNLKIALIKESPAGTYGAATTNYSDVTGNSDEVSGTGYTTGGATLTRIDPSTSGTTALTDFADPAWTTATFTSDAALIYNADLSDASIGVYDFGGTKSVTADTFTLIMPAADASNAILRLA